MKLTTYNNLYAYFITYSPSRGNEVILQYKKSTKQYTVTVLRNWQEVFYSDIWYDVHAVKGIYRECVTILNERLAI